MGTCVDFRRPFFIAPSSASLSHNPLVCSSFQLADLDLALSSSALRITVTQSQLPSQVCSATLVCSFISAREPRPGCPLWCYSLEAASCWESETMTVTVVSLELGLQDHAAPYPDFRKLLSQEGCVYCNCWLQGRHSHQSSPTQIHDLKFDTEKKLSIRSKGTGQQLNTQHRFATLKCIKYEKVIFFLSKKNPSPAFRASDT